MSAFLKAYQTEDTSGYTIEPAPAKREWMDATPNKYAYHCMPLTIANQMGWVIRCQGAFSATWNGKPEKDAITFRFPENEAYWKTRVISHFGCGIITFDIPWVFRTSPGWGLLVRGPTNMPKDNISPLDGLVETDWAPYTFTMNWRFQKRNTEVWFKKGDPICMLVPIPLNAVEECEPSFHRIEDDPILYQDYDAFWYQRRHQLAVQQATGVNRTQHGYFRGRRPDGTPVEEHRTNYKLKAFKPRPE